MWPSVFCYVIAAALWTWALLRFEMAGTGWGQGQASWVVGLVHDAKGVVTPL